VQTKRSKYVSFLASFRYWKESPAQYRKLVTGLLLFTLFNSSDVFLLLKVKDAGIDDRYVIIIYIFYNLVYALASFPLGALADKMGLRQVFLLGMFLYATVYFSIAFAESIPVFIGLFFLYGLYAAAAEGIIKAWISNICEKKDTATAIGTFSGFQSICALLASTIAGTLWYEFDPKVCFLSTGIVSVIVIIYFVFFKDKVTLSQE
jgi:MFS family permease